MNEKMENIFLNRIHLIDVRAPIEFQEGSAPNAVNLPLLNDNEREQIGIAYKNHGQKAAVDLGHQLVGGEIRQARVNAWLNEIKQFPDSIIYCFRGGLRS